jgi:transketolase
MSLAQQATHALRVLAIDAVEQAQSGHPGMPMGMADIAYVLWHKHLRHHPGQPQWFNRDRFVLSNGHGSMLLYALLHLTGYAVTLDDLKCFRQLNSKTPGHPEYGVTPGVEATTGPLGQGLANAVGMAIAEAHLAATFNRPGHELIDHKTYVFCGDGCFMEGISHEACSLAGTLGLNKLIVFWDDNGISIDGCIHDWCQDDTPGRFAAYGWHVQTVNGHDQAAIDAAIKHAHAQHDKPSLIACNTQIGFGARNKAGHASSHGAPLGAEEVAHARAHYGWQHPPFVIPKDLYQHWNALDKGVQDEAKWQVQWRAYQKKYPVLGAQLQLQMQGRFGEQWQAWCQQQQAWAKKQVESCSTRKASWHCLNALAPKMPALFGGSADLTDSNLTKWQGAQTFNQTRVGRYLHFGVREFAQNAIANGLALHGGLVPFVGTFMTFIDYGKNALRLAAMMRVRTIFVLTHDSIGLGEDGPTHQPIEHLAHLRSMPHVRVWRPCDLFETMVSWQAALSYQGPSCLVLSRQTLPAQDHLADRGHPHQGGYIITPAQGTPGLILVATGSEVGLAQQAAKQLLSTGVLVHVVSMPCISEFLSQDQTYQQAILPAALPRLFIEAGHPQSWFQLKRDQDSVLGLEDYGHSAPGAQVYQAMGLTPEHTIQAAQSLLKRRHTEDAT